MAYLRREFATTRTERAPGKFSHSFVLVCGHNDCPARQHIFFNAGLGTPREAVRQKFQQKGWEVDTHDASGDRCPLHKNSNGHSAIRLITKPKPAGTVDTSKAVARLTAPAAQPKETRPMTTVTPFVSTAQPSISDRRLIFSKLNDVYVDEKHGYKGEWDDSSVAKDLGVTVEWVRSIREQNFGPLNGNGELREMVAKAKALSTEGWKAVEELHKLGPLVQRALAIRVELEKIDKRIAEITTRNN